MWETAVLGMSVNIGASTGAGKQEMEQAAKSPLTFSALLTADKLAQQATAHYTSLLL